MSRAIEADPSLGLSERVRFAGIDYTWSDLSYAADRSRFTILFDRIERQFTSDRVYFVEAKAKYNPYPDNIHADLLLLRLMSDFEEGALELWVHMPNTRDFLVRTSTVEKGTRLAVVANKIDTTRHRPVLVLDRPEQLEISPT